MSHIFVSYSRRDLVLVQKIVDALGEQQLETWIDWKSIPKGEDWEQEIYRGIEAADAFLFLISTDSVKSMICNKELVHAIRNNKRILPIVIHEVDTADFLDGTAREEINRLNWIYCRQDQDDFARAIQLARETIRTDYDWLRFHTTLQTRALAWERAGKDGSRLLRGKELKEGEKQIAGERPETEPLLTDLQRQFMTKSRQSVRRRQALPYGMMSLLAVAVFLGGKFFYLFIPIANGCPEVAQVSVKFEDAGLPDDTYAAILDAIENSPSETAMRNCDPDAKGVIHATAGYEPQTKRIDLHIRLPETPAYRLDFLQEIREFGPELVEEQEAIALLDALSAYSVGEYQMAIETLEGNDSLSALTLLAQARLFIDDLMGSRETYDLALQEPQLDDVYTGKLYMGAALAWWRPESYYLLSFQGNKEDCKKAGKYYGQAEDWIESDKLAHNIRIAFAQFCIDEKDPAYAEYAAWKNERLESESQVNVKDAAEINAVEQYILALDQEFNDEDTRALYKNRLISAQSLMLARAALSEFYWGVEDNCREARTWREEFRAAIISDTERYKLRRLLQSQPLFCR